MASSFTTSPSTTSLTTTTCTHWLPSSPNALHEINSICLGTGRFLRSVLVPALVANEGGLHKPALIQTRGRTFMEYMMQEKRSSSSSNNSYEVDTVLPSGQVETSEIPCWGAFSLGQAADKQALLDILPKLSKGISIIGVGVTEAGLTSKETSAMKNLYELLELICKLRNDGTYDNTKLKKKICVVDMDNVPNNGDKIKEYMNDLAANNPLVQDFLNTQVVFLNTMVDRITSQREGSNGLVPRCEPTPAKALVILDPNGDWPINNDSTTKSNNDCGVVVRSTRAQLDVDIALKLRIANGTHTAIAHTLALSRFLQTNILSSDDYGNLFMKYLDALVDGQILPGAQTLTTANEAQAVYDDWRRRLIHPHFGLSSFFITQNGPAKGGIRWGPTVIDLKRQNVPFQVSMAFAYAALLRWLTPVVDDDTTTTAVSTGWLDKCGDTKPTMKNKTHDNGAVMYADGLHYHLEQGWYEYKCSIMVGEGSDSSKTTPLVKMLQDCVTEPTPATCVAVVQEYLVASDGGKLGEIIVANENDGDVDNLVRAIAIYYSRMIAGEGLVDILRELDVSKDGIGFKSSCSDLVEKSKATPNP